MDTSSKQVCEDLIALLKHMKAGITSLAEKHGLTHMQLYVMNAIHHGEITMGKVAGSLHCDASNVTGIIDRLVALGLVTRQESEQDRRAKVLQLTDKGQELFDEIAREMPAALGCERLRSVERSTLHELVARLV
jgi:DNA-binding MarR family transcriptional regulator